VFWRGRRVQVRIAGTTARVAISDGEPVNIRIMGELRSLQGGGVVEARFDPAPVLLR
jgi:hypothetical protein